MELFAANSSGTYTGVPPVGIVCPGGFDVTQVNDVSVTFSFSAPIGAPHAPSEWNVYITRDYTPTPSGSPTLTASGSARSISYTPPDGNPFWACLTETDTASAVYI